MPEAKLGVIGGSGLYEIEGLSNVKEVKVKTPFGDPSDAIVLGNLGKTKIAFLPRHGRGHRIMPTELPVRANIWALKSLGVEQIIAVNAVGSLQEDIRPLDLVIPDQIIDRTKSRVSTFFGEGIVGHVTFADPFCPVLSQLLYQVANQNVRDKVRKVLKTLEAAKEVIKKASAQLPKRRECGCATALKDAIITHRDLIPQKKKEELSLLIGKYLK
jgi:purine nucleoside phosphorylase